MTINVLVMNAIIGFCIGFVWGHFKGDNTKECFARGFGTVLISTIFMGLLRRF